MASVSPSGIVTLLTDFGAEDHYVGVMKGVITRIFPAAQLIDLCHELPPYSVGKAAFLLAQSYRYFAAGSVHLVVVDPGVGSARRALAVRAGEHYFVAPDNGVLSQVFEQESAETREIDAERFALRPMSRTFHGRDLFSPAAARLAAGEPLENLGAPVSDAVRLWPARPVELEPGRWRGRVLNIDRFGNIVTSFPPGMWDSGASGMKVRAGSLTVSRLAGSYHDAGTAGEPFLIEGSSGFLEISFNQASAAERAAVRIGDTVELVRQ